jgi:hypothetical protein
VRVARWVFRLDSRSADLASSWVRSAMHEEVTIHWSISLFSAVVYYFAYSSDYLSGYPSGLLFCVLPTSIDANLSATDLTNGLDCTVATVILDRKKSL